MQLHHRYTPYNYFESVIQFNKVLYNDSYRTDADQNGGKEFAPSVELASLADVRASRSSALSDAPQRLTIQLPHMKRQQHGALNAPFSRQ